MSTAGDDSWLSLKDTFTRLSQITLGFNFSSSPSGVKLGGRLVFAHHRSNTSWPTCQYLANNSGKWTHPDTQLRHSFQQPLVQDLNIRISLKLGRATRNWWLFLKTVSSRGTGRELIRSYLNISWYPGVTTNFWSDYSANVWPTMMTLSRYDLPKWHYGSMTHHDDNKETWTFMMTLWGHAPP